jgi:hypothetical protein
MGGEEALDIRACRVVKMAACLSRAGPGDIMETTR